VGEPGFGLSACEYMASRDISLMMGDTSANDAQPAGEQGTDYAVPCHTEMQTRRGIWNLENVDTKSLIDAKVLEGAFIWAPLRIVGGTSPGAPVRQPIQWSSTKPTPDVLVAGRRCAPRRRSARDRATANAGARDRLTAKTARDLPPAFGITDRR